MAVAVGAHQQISFGGKGSIHQRSGALTAEEAVAVPVTAFVRKILRTQGL